MRPLAWMLSAALVLAGTVVGTIHDQREVPQPERRGEWVVLEADLHAHTRFSDGFLGVPDLVMHAERNGLHVLAVTEHNMAFPGLLARSWARATSPTVVLPSEEITCSGYHVHAIGITDRVTPRHDLAGVIADVHRQGGLVMAAHPVRAFWPSLLPVRTQLDGTEVMHPIALGGGRGGSEWRWRDMLEFYEGSAAQGHRLTAIGASDYHFFSPLGVCRTLIFAHDWSESGAMEALRAGRTVVVDHHGRTWGDPAMRQLVEARPYQGRAYDRSYHARGPVDGVARLAGWLGLVGLVIFRRRP